MLLGTLHAVQIIDPQKSPSKKLEIVQPVWKLKHRQRFQTQVMMAFEKLVKQQTAQVSQIA